MDWEKGLILTRRIEMVYGVFFILFITVSITFVIQRNIKNFREFTETSYRKTMWYKDVEVTEEERLRIDQWIKINNLNKFGEPKDKVYISFPLVDDVTGEAIDRYRYILSKHPHRPWSNER